jgi:hypothetical protein
MYLSVPKKWDVWKWNLRSSNMLGHSIGLDFRVRQFSVLHPVKYRTKLTPSSPQTSHFVNRTFSNLKRRKNYFSKKDLGLAVVADFTFSEVSLSPTVTSSLRCTRAALGSSEKPSGARSPPRNWGERGPQHQALATDGHCPQEGKGCGGARRAHGVTPTNT